MENKEMQEWIQRYKEMDEFYHLIALRLNISDSALTILYGLCELGDRCLQKDICQNYCISKQTVNSSVRKLVADGLLRLENGHGRDMHLCLTNAGKKFTDENIMPILLAEHSALEELNPEERQKMIQLVKKYNMRVQEKVYAFFDKKERDNQ